MTNYTLNDNNNYLFINYSRVTLDKKYYNPNNLVTEL